MSTRVEDQSASDPRNVLAKEHGIYWILSGTWPIVHIRSFEAITGPKVDRWLVKAVASLIVAVGAGLLQGGRNNRVTPELETVAVGSALGLTAIDLVYVAKRRIRPVYLLDAVVHTALALAWRRTRSGASTSTRM